MAWASSGWLWAGSRLAAQLAQNSGSPWWPMAPGWAVSNTTSDSQHHELALLFCPGPIISVLKSIYTNKI